MKYYCVRTVFDDKGKVQAFFEEQEGQNLPKNEFKQTYSTDIYCDYFINLHEAKKFFSEATKT